MYILFKECNYEVLGYPNMPSSNITRFEEFFFYIIVPRLESYNQIIRNNEENLNFFCRKMLTYP